MAFGGLKLAAQVAGNVTPMRGRRPSAIVSPWNGTDSQLSPIFAAEEALGIEGRHAVTRRDALKVPAIVKGRAILHAIIATHPLIAMDSTGELATQPTWLYRSDTGISPYTRCCQILDDMIFGNASLLAVRRGAADAILDAAVVPYDRWGLQEDGTITVDGNPVDADQVVYIPGPGPGLLEQAADTIRAARDLDNAWMQRVKTPVPPILLQETEDNGMELDEVKQYVAQVAEARRNSGVMFIPKVITASFPQAQSVSDQLYESGRNALRLDIANFLNLPAAILDGSVAEASLTYVTQQGKRNEVFDYTVGYWTNPIEQALSQDNVVPRGQRVRFDFTDLLNPTASPTGPAEED